MGIELSILKIARNKILNHQQSLNIASLIFSRFQVLAESDESRFQILSIPEIQEGLLAQIR